MIPATSVSGPGQQPQQTEANFLESGFPLLAIGLSQESEAFLRRALASEWAAPPPIVVPDTAHASTISGPIAGGVVEADAAGGFPIAYVRYLGERDPGAPIIALIRETVPPKLEGADPLVPIIPIVLVPLSETGVDLLRRALVLARNRAGLLARLRTLEAAFERRSERFQVLTTETQVAVWDWDLAEGRIWRSEGFGVLFGYAPNEVEETLGWWSERVHPDDLERTVQRMEVLPSWGDDPLQMAYRFRARDGSYIPVVETSAAIRGERGQPLRLIGTVRRETDLPRDTKDEPLKTHTMAPPGAEAAMAWLSSVEQVTDIGLARLSLEDLFTELLGRLRTVLGADAALAHLLTEDGTTLMRRAWIGADGAPPQAVPILVGTGISGRIAMSAKPMIVEDIHAGPIHPVGSLDGFTSLLGVPLLLEGKTIGVLNVLSRARREFTQNDQSLLQIVADHVAFVIDRANLADRLQTKHRHMEALSRRLVKLQEDERRGIARELHDGAGQILTALKLALETEQPDRDRTLPLLRELSDQLGTIAMNLRPPMLDDLGLLPALRWHIRRFSMQTELDIQFHATGLTDRLRTELELAGFRIVQEALTNVARHGRTNRAVVELTQELGALRIRVSDPGAGFDPDAVTPGVGSGLIGMRERATLLGGSLSIQSSPGNGTDVIAELPVT